MKKQLLFVLVILVGMAAVVTVNASSRVVQTYEISANSNWADDKMMFSNPKEDKNSFSVVNWYSSSQKNSHNMWYRVVNSNYQQKAIALISYKSRVEIQTTAQKGYYYGIQARRENSVDPVTKVTGTWKP